MSFQPGCYYLINVKHARDKDVEVQNIPAVGREVAAMDLSEGDDQSIIAFEWHGGENQKWEFQQVAGKETFYIKNRGLGKYITFPDDPNDGKQVIATDGPREWEVRVGHEGERAVDGRESIRIFVPGIKQNLDLTNHGDITPGTRVQLWAETPGQGQAWYYIPAPQ
ncbi:hypothetical protein FRC11_003205 [Ceratobasidium sp. 423]|nr:hypothetical protein FRC11_003205 [Ceratobasidium sp. 423]